jgi:flagellar biosynthetic protein FliR
MAAGSIPGIVLDGGEMLAVIHATLWASVRVGGLLMVAPLFGTRSVPRRVKAMLALALGFAMTPLAGPPPPLPGIDPLTILTVARELLIGVAMGFVLRLAFEAGALAGEFIAQGTGLSFAVLADPLRGTNAGVVGQWFYLCFALLFLAMNGHLMLVELLADSWKAVPLTSGWVPRPDALRAVPEFGGQMFLVGIQIALPVVLAMLVVNLGFGVMSRAAPSLNPIQLGLPASLLLGLLLMSLLTGQLAGPLSRLLDEAFGLATAWLG